MLWIGVFCSGKKACEQAVNQRNVLSLSNIGDGPSISCHPDRTHPFSMHKHEQNRSHSTLSHLNQFSTYYSNVGWFIFTNNSVKKTPSSSLPSSFWHPEARVLLVFFSFFAVVYTLTSCQLGRTLFHKNLFISADRQQRTHTSPCHGPMSP